MCALSIPVPALWQPAARVEERRQAIVDADAEREAGEDDELRRVPGKDVKKKNTTTRIPV